MKYINKRNICYILFVVLILILMCLSFVCFDGNERIDENDIMDSHIIQKDIVTNIKINGILGSYDKDNAAFYYSANSFNYKNVKVISPYKVKHYIKKNDDKHYTIFVYSSKYYYQYDIYLVNIPLVNIYTYDIFDNEKCDIELNYCSMGITISDYTKNNSNNSYNILNSTGKIRVRGATSRDFEKKSYKISVEKKVKLFDLTTDNDWVLDALYSDPSKIRNKLSSDIWNEINNNQLVNNDLGVEFVEVFIDNQYKGLYTIKNNVDKHVTSLNDTGLLIKAVNHFNYNYVEMINNRTFNIEEDGSFLNMKIKEYNSDLFTAFLNRMYNYYSNNMVFDTFDEDNYFNYKILISLMSGDDNVTKNIYYSINQSNDKILITPWDMDMTWGLVFDPSSSIYSKKMMYNYNDDLRMQYDVMFDLTDESFEKVKRRYWELRKEVINMETIDSYLDEYQELLINSGAIKRDNDKWYAYDFKLEIDEIREWVKNRIIYLDAFFTIN